MVGSLFVNLLQFMVSFFVLSARPGIVVMLAGRYSESVNVVVQWFESVACAMGIVVLVESGMKLSEANADMLSVYPIIALRKKSDSGALLSQQNH